MAIRTDWARHAADDGAAGRALRWATCAKEVVAGWETPLSEDATWGVETLRATGEPFALNEDPLRKVRDHGASGLRPKARRRPRAVR
jgi:hypothetical protein